MQEVTVMCRIIDVRMGDAQGGVHVVAQEMQVLALESERWSEHEVPGACELRDGHERDGMRRL